MGDSNVSTNIANIENARVSTPSGNATRNRSYSAISEIELNPSSRPGYRSRIDALRQNKDDANEGDSRASSQSYDAIIPDSETSNRNALRTGSSLSRRRTDLPELERVSVSHLRHQNSSATIRSPTTPSEDVAGPGALRKERRKKSALLEQELTRMRSESRLGSRQARHSPESERQTVGDGADTSGTEGSGPVIGNRRRKKSSTSSASKKAAAANFAPHTSHSSDHFSTHRSSGASTRRGSDGQQTEYASTVGKNTSTSARRTAIPANFRSNNLNESKDWNTSSLPPKPRGSTMVVKDRQEWPKSHEGDGNPSPHSTYRARRFASDADAADLPYRSHRSSLGTSGGGSRHSGRDTGDIRAASVMDKAVDPADILQSPSEAARQRKVSTSSSYSHRSSGGASDLQRSASRASMRRAHGRDVFDDIPPLPERSNHPLSPRFTALDHRDKFERVQSLRERQRLDNNHSHENRGTSSIEELRLRIDELTGTHTGVPRTQSRTSSRASRARSNISSTPSTSVATTSATSVRPMNEGRKSNVYAERTQQIDLSPESRRNGSAFRQHQAPSRLGVQLYNDQMPHTPETSFTSNPRSANSRMGGHYSVAGSHQVNSIKSSARSLGERQAQGPLHARNLQSCIDNLERRLLGPNASDPAVMDASPDTVQMIAHLREACSASVEINNGLRTLIQAVLGLQIDAELGSEIQGSVAAFAQIERGMGTVLRWSDDQMRNLTDGFMSLANSHEFVPQSMVDVGDRSNGSIRLNTRSTQTLSPSKHNRLANDDRLHRRSSLDMRRFNTPTIRNTPWTNRRGANSQIGLNNTEIVRRSPTIELDRASPINSKDSDLRSLSDRSLRRFTASALPSGNASPLSSTSPFSHHSGSVTSKQSSSRIRQSVTPVGGEGKFSRTRSQGEDSNGMGHSRSFSEIPQPLDRISRDRGNSIPASLSPQKPRPSIARVTTINVSTNLSSDDTSALEDENLISPNSKDNKLLPSSFEDADEETSIQTASADTILAKTNLSSNSRKSIANGGLGLGLDNVTSRIARSLGRNAGRNSTPNRPKLDLDQFTRNDVD